MNSSANSTRSPTVGTGFDVIVPDDATWILTSAFIIFTMQSGFGLLEAGMVSKKNETNIMVKNAVDVIYGGLSYWLFGFAFSFGNAEGSNAFCGIGYFLTDAEEEDMGNVFAKYFFQLSFATTSTTIVSGAMAERVNLKAYTLFSFINTLSFSFPAHWMWAENGWLKQMGAIDVAGCGPVHLVGGVSGLVATLMLKPRTGRFDEQGKPRPLVMASPTNVLLGTFMLWWGWLGFNCGSTFGITGGKWKLASRSAVVTLNGSIGGGILGMLYSYIFYKNKLLIDIFATGILGGLVSITGVCAIVRPWEAILIGSIGGIISCGGCTLLQKLRIDDPVGCVPVHFFTSAWGLIAVGLFVEKDSFLKISSDYGILKGGSWHLLGVQLLCIVTVGVWSAVMTFIMLFAVNCVIPLRMPLEMELEGADKWEHGILQADDYLGYADDKRMSGCSGVDNMALSEDEETHEAHAPTEESNTADLNEPMVQQRNERTKVKNGVKKRQGVCCGKLCQQNEHIERRASTNGATFKSNVKELSFDELNTVNNVHNTVNHI